ncbi:MAG: hypothetical protein IJW31_02165 [Lentisphaeria bacterium]|nr:hypothetical protein [Lentisphaeria bacterium]
MLKKVFTVCLLSVFLLNPLLIKANDILEKRDNLSQCLQDIEKVMQNYDTKLFTVKKVGDLEISDYNDEADNFYMMLKLNYKVEFNRQNYKKMQQDLTAILKKCAVSEFKIIGDDNYYTFRKGKNRIIGFKDDNEVYTLWEVPSQIFDKIRSILHLGGVIEFSFHRKKLPPVKRYQYFYTCHFLADYIYLFENSVSDNMPLGYDRNNIIIFTDNYTMRENTPGDGDLYYSKGDMPNYLVFCLNEEQFQSMADKDLEINVFAGARGEYYRVKNFDDTNFYRADFLPLFVNSGYMEANESVVWRNFFKKYNYDRNEGNTLLDFEEELQKFENKFFTDRQKLKFKVSAKEVKSILNKRDKMTQAAYKLGEIFSDYSYLYSMKQKGKFELDANDNLNDEQVQVKINFDLELNKNEYRKFKTKILTILAPHIIDKYQGSDNPFAPLNPKLQEFLCKYPRQAIDFFDVDTKKCEIYAVPRFFLKTIEWYLRDELFFEFTFPTKVHGVYIEAINCNRTSFWIRGKDSLRFCNNIISRQDHGKINVGDWGRVDNLYNLNRFYFTRDQLKILQENPKIQITTGQDAEYLFYYHSDYRGADGQIYNLTHNNYYPSLAYMRNFEDYYETMSHRAAFMEDVNAQKEYWKHGGIGISMIEKPLLYERFHKEDFAKMDSWQIIASDNPILTNGMRLALKNADFHEKIKAAKVGDVITLELAHGAKIDCVVREIKEEEKIEEIVAIEEAEDVQEVQPIKEEKKIVKSNKTPAPKINKKDSTTPAVTQIAEKAIVEEKIPQSYDLETLHELERVLKQCKNGDILTLSMENFIKITKLHNLKANFPLASKLNQFLYCFMPYEQTMKYETSKLPKSDRMEVDKKIKKVKCSDCKNLKKPKRNCDSCEFLRKNESIKIGIQKYNELLTALQSEISSQL